MTAELLVTYYNQNSIFLKKNSQFVSNCLLNEQICSLLLRYWLNLEWQHCSSIVAQGWHNTLQCLIYVTPYSTVEFCDETLEAD